MPSTDQVSTNHAVADSAQARLLTLASSPSLAEGLAKIRRGDASTLTPAEALQTACFRHAIFRGFENIFFQYRAGLLSKQAWPGYMGVVRGQFEREPDLGVWWSGNNQYYDSEFQVFVEGLRDSLAVQQVAPAADPRLSPIDS
jgi:hypothetical protein